MRPIDVVKKILDDQYGASPKNKMGEVFAPANIALCKYWGKRDTNLNLPVTSSLSISLGDKGARTHVTLAESNQDVVKLNHKTLEQNSMFVQRIIKFLDLFREKNNLKFVVETHNNIPVGAGLASSAAGFAALIQALDQLFGWELPKKQLSILARLGSGSACRSLWQGLVKWHAGSDSSGLDSFAQKLPYTWPDLMIGLLPLSVETKSVSSRDAMQRTVTTSRYYELWPKQVEEDLQVLLCAIEKRDFKLFGETAENNALTMHALALTSKPPILYSIPATIVMIQHIWKLRESGINIYFTQDAGANLILLFLQKDVKLIKKEFAEVEIIMPFVSS